MGAVGRRRRCAYVQGMADIELERHQYADRDPRTGKWRRPLSKKAARGWFIASLIPISYVCWNATALQPMTLFWGTLVSTAIATIFLSAWLRDVY